MWGEMWKSRGDEFVEVVQQAMPRWKVVRAAASRPHRGFQSGLCPFKVAAAPVCTANTCKPVVRTLKSMNENSIESNTNIGYAVPVG